MLSFSSGWPAACHLFLFLLPLFLISFFSVATPLSFLESCVFSLNLPFSNPIHPSLSFPYLVLQFITSLSFPEIPFCSPPPKSMFWCPIPKLLISSLLIPNVFTDLWAKRQNPQGRLSMPTQWKAAVSIAQQVPCEPWISGWKPCQWKVAYVCLYVYVRCMMMLNGGVLGFFFSPGSNEN